MEIIDWLAHEKTSRWDNPNLVAFALIEAISKKDNSLDSFKIDGKFDAKALEVEFKVNGVEVSFVGVMQSIQEAVTNIEQDCRKTLYKDAAKSIIELLEKEYRTWED